MPFQVTFEGLKENTPEQKELVKGKLIDKFKLPVEKAEKMMVSAPIVVKKGLTQDQANKYKSALESIGAIATIQLIPDTNEPQLPTPIQESPTPIEQIANIVKSPEAIPKRQKIDAPEEIKISESKPLPPLLEVQSPQSSKSNLNPLESDYPIFYGEVEPHSSEAVKETPDIHKTNVQAAHDPNEGSTIQQPASNSAKTNKLNEGEWWKTVYVLDFPFDEAAKSVTPITSGRISANEFGFSISHPMIERIPFDDVQILSSCQVGVGSNPRLFIDIFISSTPRPIRLDLDLMNFASFGINRPDNPAERLAAAVTAFIERNHLMMIDLATYKLLKDKSKIKIVATDRDIEKYCGKIQLEVDKGLSRGKSDYVITCEQANELLNTTDPWASPPPLPPPQFGYAGNQIPQTMFNPAPGMPPSGFGNPRQIPPPNAYNTQMSPPPNTNPGTFQNQTQMSPPSRSPMPPNQPPPPMPYSSPYQQPNPQYPPAPGFNPQPNNPYVPPQVAMGQKPFPSPPPMPGQPPAYQPQGYPPPMPGQYPVAQPIGQFGNQYNSSEINKAIEEANTSLILSIIGLFCTCLFPISVVALIKSQNALKILDQYGIEQNRNKAHAAKIISIIALIISAIAILSRFMH